MNIIINSNYFPKNIQKIEDMIKKDLIKNINNIKDESFNLDVTERNKIYKKYYKTHSAWIGILINCLLFGFMGIGNFIQKDKKGGLITLIGYMMNIIIFIIICLIVKSFAPLYLGAMISMGFCIYGIIRSINYPFYYNKKLKNALNLELE